ncbi:MAG: discoidin domain-containing protein, partial [Chloroflexota bacterium]
MRQSFHQLFKRYRRQQSAPGQGLVEYALLLGLVALVVIAIIELMGPAIEDVFERLANRAPLAPPSLVSYTPPPSYTPIPSIDPAWTSTPVPSPTNTITPTNTIPPTATNTSTPTATATPTCLGYGPYAVPGRVQMEAFACGGSNVSFVDSTGDGGPGSGAYRQDVTVEGPDLAAISGGFYLGWLVPNEWVMYSVNASSAGVYDLSFRVASANGNGRFRVEVIRDNNLAYTSPSVAVPSTGGSLSWSNLSVPNVPLFAGANRLRVVFEAGNFNLDYFDASSADIPLTPSNTPTPTVTSTPTATATPTATPTEAASIINFRYIRLISDSAVFGNPWAAVAELNLLNGSGGTVSRSNWTVAYVDSEETLGENGRATNAFDGNNSTIWHTEWYNSSPVHPHDLQINLGGATSISGFRYLPRQNQTNGRIADYRFCASVDGTSWYQLSSGSFPNTTALQTVTFTPPTNLNGLPGCQLSTGPLQLINANFNSGDNNFDFTAGAFGTDANNSYSNWENFGA